MSYRNPMVRFFGTQRDDSGRAVASVPYFEVERPKTSLKPDKKKHLESMLEREKAKAKRERVSVVLIQKLVTKFGMKNSAVVSFFVEEFMGSHDTITSDDLAKLEKEISNAVVVQTSEPKPPSAAASSEGQNSSQPQTESANRPPTRPPTGSEWQVINAYYSIVNEEKEKEEKQLARQKKIDFKNSLDAHLVEARKFNYDDRSEGVKYAQFISKSVQEQTEKERLKQENIRRRNREEVEFRKRQIEEHQRRLQEEREALRLAEERNQKRADDIFQRDLDKKNLTKQQENEMRAKIARDNEENNRRKAIQKEIEAEEDRRLMAEYAAKLDREAAARESAFQARMEEMEGFAQKYETDGAGKALREENLRVEQLLLKEQKKKEEQDLAKEQLKQKQARLRQQLALAENQRQLEQRKKDEVEERRRDLLLAEKYREDSREYTQSEVEKRRREKERQARYRETLNKQMDDVKRQDTNLVGISEKEKELNMGTLRKVNDDPLLLSRVLHRVRIAKGSQGK